VVAPLSTANRGQADFSTTFVLEALVAQGLLTAQQAQEVLAREPAARARVLKAKGQGNTKEAARYDVSPVEIVAAFQVQLPGCAAPGAGAGFPPPRRPRSSRRRLAREAKPCPPDRWTAEGA
jgi:general secretion pathway protein E